MILSNVLWNLLEKLATKIVNLVVTIILARLISPDDYGTIALATVFFAIFGVFIDSGLGNALIQKKDADDLDFSTVFYFNIFISIVLYAIMFIFAPAIANFYCKNELTQIIRVISINLLISGVKNTEEAYIAKKMMFKNFFIASSFGTIGSAIIGIIMAINGYGVWALVFSSIFDSFLDMLILWFTIDWRPSLNFSFDRLKKLFGFGFTMLTSSVMYTIYEKISQLLIGKYYSSENLAFYNKGEHFPNTITTSIISSINSVIFSSLSSIQNDLIKVKETTRNSIKISLCIITPILLGMYIISDDLIPVLLTSKWNGAIVYIKIFSIVSIFKLISSFHINVIKALGYGKTIVKADIIKRIIGLLLLFIFINKGVLFVAIAVLITELINMIINCTVSVKIIDYKISEQLNDIIKSIIPSLIMVIFVRAIRLFLSDGLSSILIRILFGIIIYVISIRLLNKEFYYQCTKTIKLLIKNVKTNKENS